MKLRLTSDSIRLRLNSSDVNDFAVLGKIEEKLDLGPDFGGSVVFCLETSGRKDVKAVLAGAELKVIVPAVKVDHWLNSDQIGIEASQNSGGRDIRILVEKDLGRGFGKRHHIDSGE